MKYHEVISLLSETWAHLCELQYSQQQVLHVMLVIIEMHGPTAAVLPAKSLFKAVKNSRAQLGKILMPSPYWGASGSWWLPREEQSLSLSKTVTGKPPESPQYVIEFVDWFCFCSFCFFKGHDVWREMSLEIMWGEQEGVGGGWIRPRWGVYMHKLLRE